MEVCCNKYSRTPLIQINWDGKQSRYAENLDFFLKIGYTVTLKFGCYYLQYVPVSKPFNHSWFEVLEAITLYCTWSNNQ